MAGSHIPMDGATVMSDGIATGVTSLNGILIADPSDETTHGRHYQSKQQSPERALFFAILEITLHTLVNTKPQHHRSKLFLEDLNWLKSHARHHPCTFENICDALDLDANGIRIATLQRIRMNRRAFERTLVKLAARSKAHGPHLAIANATT